MLPYSLAWLFILNIVVLLIIFHQSFVLRTLIFLLIYITPMYGAELLPRLSSAYKGQAASHKAVGVQTTLPPTLFSELPERQ